MLVEILMRTGVGVVAATALALGGVAPAGAIEPAPEDDPSSSQPLLDLSILGAPLPIKAPAPLVLPGLGVLDLGAPTASQPAAEARYGGGASAARASVDLGGQVVARTTRLAALDIPPTGGPGTERSLLTANIPALLNLWGVRSRVRTSNVSSETVEAESSVTKFHVAPGLLGLALIEGSDVNSSATIHITAGGKISVRALSTFGFLSVAGIGVLGGNPLSPTGEMFAPNTVLEVPGLGRVVLNEQKITTIPGEKYAVQVHAVHITLSKALAGYPVGADLYIGSAEAVLTP